MAARQQERASEFKKLIVEGLRDIRLALVRVYKPTREEFIQAFKVIMLGLTVVGLVAYIIHLIGISLLGG